MPWISNGMFSGDPWFHFELRIAYQRQVTRSLTVGRQTVGLITARGNMKYGLTVVALWGIAILATSLIVRDARLMTFLGPLYTICMIGTVITVRTARRSSTRDAA